jgi:guanylate kinase
MLIIVSGPSCVGKSFTVAQLCDEYGFLSITPYTTREPRISEAEGLHYHFRSEKDVRELSSNFSRGYWATPLNKHWYGYTEHVDDLIDNPKNWIIHAYSDIALSIKSKHPAAHTIFLDFRTDKVLIERINERYGKNEDELKSRMEHAEHERSQRQHFDQCVSSDNHETIAKGVIKIALSKVVQTPNPGTLAGALSDVDISTLLLPPAQLKVEGLNERPLKPHGWSFDSPFDGSNLHLLGGKTLV